MMVIAGLVLDIIIAGLLIATIIYCMILDRRIRSFKLEQSSLAGVIGDLNNATQSAEVAVAGLKMTSQAAEGDLGGKLNRARSLSDELAFMVETGNNIASKLAEPSMRGEKRAAAGDNIAMFDTARGRHRKVEPAFSNSAPKMKADAQVERLDDTDSLARMLRQAR